MKTYKSKTLGLSLGIALLSLAVRSPTAAPNNNELDAAINDGNFGVYVANLSAWLNEKVPAGATETALLALLKDPAVANALDQRQLISKMGAAALDGFARAEQGNKAFLGWLLRNTAAMDLYLEGAVPTGLNAREQNNYGLPVGSLEIWKRILNADSDSKEGLYLRLAIATALEPPGSGNHGAGQAHPPADPLARYKHFKTAHQNKELFPSFDHLTVWEYRQVVSSCASDEDLTWAREMINTWRPDLRNKELVVNSTSEVWRRNSPHPYTDYKSVLSGGGKCGPRSSWAVMICQAFGLPCVGVGQPAHACAAYRTDYPSVEPQPGNAWKVVQGRGWAVSRLPEGLGGNDWLAGVNDKVNQAAFSQVEHLRWLAASLTTKEQAVAVMDVAHQIQKTAAAAPAVKAAEPPVPLYAKPEAPIPAKPGVIHVEAENFVSKGDVWVHDCYTGGKQVHFPKSSGNGWVEYSIDVPASGIYTLTMQTAAANLDQAFNVSVGVGAPTVVNVPYTTGLWGMTEATDLPFAKGKQTLKVAAPNQRGVAVRWLELKAKGT